MRRLFETISSLIVHKTLNSQMYMVSGLCRFVFSRQKDEKAPCEKTKTRHEKKTKENEITPCEKMKNATKIDDKINVLNDVFCMAFFRLFALKFRLIRVAGFVFSHDVIYEIIFPYP